MKYHYIIISSWDPTDIHSHSMNILDDDGDNFQGYLSETKAETAGEMRMIMYNLDPNQYYVKVVPAYIIISPLTEEQKIADICNN